MYFSFRYLAEARATPPLFPVLSDSWFCALNCSFAGLNWFYECELFIFQYHHCVLFSLNCMSSFFRLCCFPFLFGVLYWFIFILRLVAVFTFHVTVLEHFSYFKQLWMGSYLREAQYTFRVLSTVVIVVIEVIVLVPYHFCLISFDTVFFFRSRIPKNCLADFAPWGTCGSSMFQFGDTVECSGSVSLWCLYTIDEFHDTEGP